MKDSFMSIAICCASSAGMPMINRSEGNHEFPVGSTDPTYAEPSGAFSAMPVGKASMVAQIGPPGINVLKKSSELLNCARPHKFLICSPPANRIIDLTSSGEISVLQGPITMNLPRGVIFPAFFLLSSNRSGVAFKCSAAPPQKSGVPTVKKYFSFG